eukprot:TRINITY_DN79974_c0_g1_i1.p1 TRINITY_DN79974_c0_g1~~TRINITY_DN79974_c0_g1_i1.p1  ORF type:complete len:375 (-),score=125.92 TRINITY_DN79974_c0_g1_i1:212-1336(-)
MLGIGTNANLAVDEEVKKGVEGEGEQRFRAVKVVADPKGERLVVDGTVPETASLAEDFNIIRGLLEDGKPCLVLVRLKGAAEGEEASAPGADDKDWAMLCWAPDNAPVKLRMLTAASKKTLQKELGSVHFKEYNCTEPEEATLPQFIEATRKLTNSERRAAMTREEQDAEDVRIQFEKEKKTAPKKLAGLVALQVKVQDSFPEAMKKLLEEDSKAVVARLTGATSEELSGEVLDDVSAPSKLKGNRLPAAEPCYVVLRPKEGHILLISWLPDNAAAKMKMKCSTFKSSVSDVIKEAIGDAKFATVELSDEDELEDCLAEDPFKEKASQAAEPKPGGYGGGPPAGFRPPMGGFALPGMGKGAGKPPGAVAMPGMR